VSRSARLYCVQPVKPPISPDLNPVDYEIWAVTQRRVYQRQIHSVDELKRQFIMSGAALNCRFLTRLRLLISGKRKFKHVSVLKEDTSSTACELTMLISSPSVTLNVTCLTVASLITTSCQQRYPIHSCSFYQVVD